MNKKFISLGVRCNITYLSRELHLNGPATIFDWIYSRNLQMITDVIHRIKDNIDDSIVTGRDRDVFILELWTNHYDLEEYRIIFKRRAKRFIELIKESSELLFVRLNMENYKTSAEEINLFCDAIHSIHPELKIKFLLIDTVSTSTEKIEESKIKVKFLHKEFLKEDCPDEYLRDNKKIKTLFLGYLDEIGYPMVNYFIDNPDNEYD